MAFELVYTSAPRGIKPGSSGFCTVAYTNGLAANAAAQLEALSAYKAYFPPYDEHASMNPVAYSHYRVVSSGEELHVLSRICFNGLDYTKRSNKLAHHLILRQHDLAQAPAGPAALFQQPGLFFCAWNREPQLFPRQKDIAATDAGSGPATTWEACTGDAGWAGTLVERYLQAPARPVYIIFDPLQHHDVLKLLAEAMLLLPPADRWALTFNTYFTTLPAGISCAWRFCVPNADALREARRSPGTLIIDLTQKMPIAPDGKWQNLARSAIVPPSPEAAALPTSAGDAPADQLRAAAPNTTADTAKLKASASRPTSSAAASRASARAKAPARKHRLLVPALIGAMIFLLLAAGGVFALKHAAATQNDDPAATAETAAAHDGKPSDTPSGGTPPPSAGTGTGTATGLDALTQRAAVTADAPAPQHASTTAAGAPPPAGDTTSTTSQQPAAPEQPTPPQPPAAGATDAPQQQLQLQLQQQQPPAVAAAKPIPETPALPKLDFNCLDLGSERDRSYLWLLNFMGHFKSIDLMLANSEEKIVAVTIRKQVVEVKDDKITVWGDMAPVDRYHLTYSGRKVTIKKTDCQCPEGNEKNTIAPCCTHALLGFKTTSGKEYLTYPVPGFSKIPDVKMDGSPADLACPLSYRPVGNKMPAPEYPIFILVPTPDLESLQLKFRARLQLVYSNVQLAYVINLPNDSPITLNTSTVALSNLKNLKASKPYRDALANLSQKIKELNDFERELNKPIDEKQKDDAKQAAPPPDQQGNKPTKGTNLQADEKERKAKEQAVAQAAIDFNKCGEELVKTLAQGKLSLCIIDSQGQRHVIKDNIRMQVKP